MSARPSRQLRYASGPAAATARSMTVIVIYPPASRRCACDSTFSPSARSGRSSSPANSSPTRKAYTNCSPQSCGFRPAYPCRLSLPDPRRRRRIPVGGGEWPPNELRPLQSRRRERFHLAPTGHCASRPGCPRHSRLASAGEPRDIQGGSPSEIERGGTPIPGVTSGGSVGATRLPGGWCSRPERYTRSTPTASRDAGVRCTASGRLRLASFTRSVHSNPT